MSKRHDQRGGATRSKQSAQTLDITWMAPLLEDLREAWGYDLWFGAEDVDPTAPATAEQRLRLMTNKGFLEMRALRDSDNKFVQFEWKVVR